MPNNFLYLYVIFVIFFQLAELPRVHLRLAKIKTNSNDDNNGNKTKIKSNRKTLNKIK